MSGQQKVDPGTGQGPSKTSFDQAAAFAERSYDYLIVGAGTAGLALAARLSESGEYTVGVLEAGISGLGDPIIDVPGKFGAGIASVYDCELLVSCLEKSLTIIHVIQGGTPR